MLRLVFASVLVLTVHQHAFAVGMTVQNYLESKTKGGSWYGFSKPWLDGLYDGMLVSSALVMNETGKGTFCPPDNMVMATSQLEAIIDGHLKRNKITMNQPIAVLLINELISMFPCR
ncbi:MAG TPA: hypothetical protein VD978_20315 [Azospirillum sp.]|nr:hypothetical protein [Azospirillum sp.]